MKKPAKKSKAKKSTKAKKVVKPTKATGRGNPEATKSVNPQSTLDLKKARVESIGGKMVYTGRKWVITMKDKTVIEFISREIAALSADELMTKVSK
jgi:hypothetical protein